ncbi:MAG TPA: DUF6152 family protein [Noviherbaspirillum sp.]
MKRFAILAFFIAAPVLAHHGWSEYDDSRPLKLEGTIEDSGYVHPHGFIRLKTGERTWTVVLAPPTRMKNRGLDKEMLAPGKRAAVVGYPNRNNAEEMRAERITVDAKTTELR